MTYTQITFGLSNVGGVNKVNKIFNVMKFMSRNKLDWGVFPESHFDQNSHKKWEKILKAFKMQIIYTTHTTKRKGLLFIYNPNNTKVLKTVLSEESRLLVIDIICRGKKYRIISIYGTNINRYVWWTRILKKLKKLVNKNTIILGDFNFVMDKKDKTGKFNTKNLAKIFTTFQKLTKTFEIKPTNLKYTFKSRGTNNMSRIDRIYCHEFLYKLQTQARIVNKHISNKDDHWPMIIKIGKKPKQKRRNDNKFFHWVMNKNILDDKVVQKYIDNILEVVNKVPKRLVQRACESPYTFKIVSFPFRETHTYRFHISK